jgi:lambda family phage portal protein
LGISYAELSNDLTDVNYSSIRQGAISERDYYRTMQSWLINHLAKPVYREWHKAQVLGGNFEWSMDKALSKFIPSAEFRGRGFAWVDPQKEINAAVDAVQSGFMSLSDVQLQYGRDPEEVFSQIQQDLQMAERYGIEVGHFRPLGPKQPFFLDLTQIQTDGASTMPEGNVSKKQPGRPRNPTESENG